MSATGNPAPPASTQQPWPPKYLTVTEAAGALSRPRHAVLRLIHAGQLRSIRLGRSYRIRETEIHRYLAEAPHEETLDLPECARILRCPVTTINALVHHGHLAVERPAEPGPSRIPATEFLRFLHDAER